MIQLSVPTQDITWTKKNDNQVDVTVLVLYPYYVECDANGNSFDIKEEDVRKVHDEYNKTVQFKWTKLQKMGKEIPIVFVENAPNQLDHDQSSAKTVGHVIGEMQLIEKEGGPFLFAKLRVKGKENVERVEDGRFSQVSLGFDTASGEVFEISWVMRGAIPGAQRILSKGNINRSVDIYSKLEFNPINVTSLKATLLSKYEENRKLIEEKENDIEIGTMLTNLLIDGKILPKDQDRIRVELKRIPDKQARLSAFNLIQNNLREVIDYSVRSKNHLSISLEDSMAKKDGLLDLSSIAARSAALLKKGKAAKFEEKESDDENEEEKGRIEKQEKKEEKESKEFSKKKFSKKDLKHCMSLAEDGDTEEMGKYLSAHFMSEEAEENEDIEGEEDAAEKKEEKEKAKFSAENRKMKEEIANLKRSNEDLHKNFTVLNNAFGNLNKGTEEARALFSEIVKLEKGNK